MEVGVLEEITEECSICKGHKEKERFFDNYRLLLPPTFLTQFNAEIT